MWSNQRRSNSQWSNIPYHTRPQWHSHKDHMICKCTLKIRHYYENFIESLSWIVTKLPSHNNCCYFYVASFHCCIAEISLILRCFARLKAPLAAKRGFLSDFGSRHRYSGRTLYESRIFSQSIDRIAPDFDRSMTGSRRMAGSRSMDYSASMSNYEFNVMLVSD